MFDDDDCGVLLSVFEEVDDVVEEVDVDEEVETVEAAEPVDEVEAVEVPVLVVPSVSKDVSFLPQPVRPKTTAAQIAAADNLFFMI